MCKIIMGGPGSGKTTLPRGVSRLTDVGCTEPNLVACPSQDPGIPMKSDRELFEEVKLIIHGMYTGWCDPLIFEADMVVWLDPPSPIAV
jgi:adenylate kinase family enzyme